MTLGEKIHALRVEHDMTMEDLAKKVGVQRSAINKYEKGQFTKNCLFYNRKYDFI